MRSHDFYYFEEQFFAIAFDGFFVRLPVKVLHPQVKYYYLGKLRQ